MRWNRVVLLFLIAFMLMSLIGCGGSQTPAPENEDPKPVEDNTSGQTEDSQESEDLASIFSKGRNIDGLVYEYAISIDSEDVELSGKVWLTSNKSKQEMNYDNQVFIQITDMDAKTMTTYSPAVNTALVMKFDAAVMDLTASPYDFMDDDLIGEGKFMANELLGTINTTVWTTIDEDGNNIKMWIHQQHGIPVRIELTEPTGEKMIIEYKNLQSGPIPDTEFTIPDGAQIINMN